MKRRFRYRSAITGLYVSKTYALRYPKRTVRESAKPTKPAKKKRKSPGRWKPSVKALHPYATQRELLGYCLMGR